MAKPDTLFKRTANRLLTHLSESGAVGGTLPSEHDLAALCEVSRTTIRSALLHLERLDVIARDGRAKIVRRKPATADYFAVAELRTRSDEIERVFMERVFRRDLRPGQEFSESELAREAGAGTASVREFLIRFSRFGLIEKKPQGGWRLCAFDLGFARELADMRFMLELRAIDRLRSLPPDASVWAEAEALRRAHLDLRPRIATRYKEFPALDRRLHAIVIGVLDNRFARSFYDHVSLIFHYHYQWSKAREQARIAIALDEHLAILDALGARDVDAARAAMEKHLATAQATLLASIETAQGGGGERPAWGPAPHRDRPERADPTSPRIAAIGFTHPDGLAITLLPEGEGGARRPKVGGRMRGSTAGRAEPK